MNFSKSILLALIDNFFNEMSQKKFMFFCDKYFELKFEERDLKMITDQALTLLEAKLGQVYEKIDKPQEPTYFYVIDLAKTINELQVDLEEKRRDLCDELRSTGESSNSQLQQFTNGLDDISRDLDKVEKSSKDLARFCAQLTVDFTHITDKLDAATSVLSKAVLIQSFLTDITIYDSSQDFDSVKNILKEKSGLSFAEPGDENLLNQAMRNETQNLYFANYVNSIKNTKSYASKNLNLHRTSEYISKIFKIVDVIQKQNVVKTAYANLDRHKSMLIKALYDMFINSEGMSIEELKNITNSLTLLGYGEKIIETYISSSPILASTQSSNLQYTDSLLLEENSRIISRFELFTKFIAKTCGDLWPTIQKIFERPQLVKLRVIKTVCAVLSTFISGVLGHYIDAKQDEVYCKTFAIMYQLSGNMIDAIYKIDNTEVATKQSILDELFSALQKRYGGTEISVYINHINSRLEVKFDLLERAMKPITIFRKAEDIVDPFTVFSEELFPEIISISKQTLVRLSLLSKPDHVKGNLKKITEIFLDDNFSPLMVSFVKAAKFYISQNPEVIGNIPKFLKLIMMLNSNVLSLEEIYNNTLKALFKPYASVHQQFLKAKEDLISQLEQVTVSGLETCIACITNYSTKQLAARQKRTDFLPPFEDALPVVTDACLWFGGFFRKLINDISCNITGENEISFMTILGNSLFDCIIDHLTTFKYNMSGGLNLMMDAAEYQSAFQLMHIASIDQMFYELSKVSHLMTVQPEQISDLFADLPLSGNATHYAKKFLQLRVDEKKFNLNEILAERI